MLDGGATGADMVPNPKYTWWSYGNRFDVQASHVKQKNEKKNWPQTQPDTPPVYISI